MPAGTKTPILSHLRRTLLDPALSDGQLLDRFDRDNDTVAFEGLTRRHGSMVLGVCRRILGNTHDAEDAYQTTFVVLARKAATISPKEAVANWLHGVAYVASVRLRTANARRSGRERSTSHPPERALVEREDRSEDLASLDVELAGLPAKYRSVIVLCDLEERSRKDAARQLGIPEGTVSSRLATGRKLLAKRLARRGVVASAGACIASSAVPRAFGDPSSVVLKLTEEVLKAMFIRKLKQHVAMLAFTLLTVTFTTVAFRPAAGQPAPNEVRPGVVKPDGDDWQGVWKVTSMRRGDEDVHHEPTFFLVHGDRMRIRSRSETIEGGLHIDASSKPKAFDFATSGPSFKGIYSLEGNSLTICYEIAGATDLAEVAKRPKRMAVEAKGRQVLAVLKRQSKIATMSRPDGSVCFLEIESLKLLAAMQNDPQKKSRVGNIYLVGNKRTADKMIRDCIGLEPGEPLDYPKILEAQKKLAALGLFADGATVTVVEDNDSNFKDIIVSVTELEPRKTLDSTRESLERLERRIAEVDSVALRAALLKESQLIRANFERLCADEVRTPAVLPPAPLQPAPAYVSPRKAE
jgi:RNA polymerase sigma factor (sigma-70 family)